MNYPQICSEVALHISRLQVYFVCQSVRVNTQIMGGMQVIVIGDFYQLPPVHNKWISDPGKCCFQSDMWSSIVHSHYTNEGDLNQINSVVCKFVQQYRRSDASIQHLLIMFNCDKLQNPHMSVGVSMLMRIQDYYFADSSNTVQQQSAIVQEPYSQNPSKVIYIGGMCVGRVLWIY